MPLRITAGGIFLANNISSTVHLITVLRHKSDQACADPESAAAKKSAEQEIKMMLLMRWRQAYLLGLMEVPKDVNIEEVWRKHISDIYSPESPSNTDPGTSSPSLKK